MGRRQVELADRPPGPFPVPEFFLEAIERREGVDAGDVFPHFQRQLANTVAETVGADLDELEEVGIVGEVVFTGGGEFRFEPADRFQETIDGGGPPAPDVVADALLEDLDEDLEATTTCAQVRDVLLDRARVLIEMQPSPFDEQEAGDVGRAMDAIKAEVATRMDELNCATTGTRNRIFVEWSDQQDAVRQARPVAEREAREFVERWSEVAFFPRFTFEDIVERIVNVTVPEMDSRTMTCRGALDALEELGRAVHPVPQARQLLDTQQRGSDTQVKEAADARASEIFDVLEERGCLEVEEPDFQLDDLRDVWRDVSLAIIRPSQNLSLEVEQLRILIHRIGLPPSERIGTQRAVPGTEDEERRREGQVSGVRIGVEGMLDDRLAVAFEDVDPSPLQRFELKAGEGRSVEFGLIRVKGKPFDDVKEQVRAIVREAVFLEDLEEGQQFGSFQTNEAGDALAKISLAAGTPVRTDDIGDLVRRIRQVADTFES